MAVRTWVGSVTGLWTTAGNWLENSVPVNGDDLIFGAAATRAPDPIDQGTINPDSLSIQPTYRYSFGTSGSPIILGTIPLANLCSGSNLIHLNASATLSFVKLMQGQVLLMKGTWAGLYGIGSGLLDVDGAAITNSQIRGLRVKMGAGATPTRMTLDRASVESSRNITALDLINSQALTTGTAAITTLLNAGRLNHRSTGTIGTMYATGRAVVDPTGGPGFTITTLVRDPDAIIMREVLGSPITITNDRPLASMGSSGISLSETVNTGVLGFY